MGHGWNQLLTAGLLLALLGNGCGGGMAVPEQQQADQGSLGGSIEVEGALLVNLDGSGGPGLPDEAKVGVRVIEPIVDIDGVEIDNSGTVLAVTPVPPGTAKLLQLSLLPAVDLEGTGAASTPVLLSIPLSVAAGELTNVAIQVQFGQSTGAAKAGSEAERPWFVRLRYQLSGPGAVSRSLRIRWKDRRVQYDSNLDDNFDDEAAFADTDRDGLSDDHRELLDNQARERPLVELSGVLASFAADTQVLELAEGGRLRLNEATCIMLNGAAVRPAALQAGDQLTVRGYASGDNPLLALEISAQRGQDSASRR